MEKSDFLKYRALVLEVRHLQLLLGRLAAESSGCDPSCAKARRYEDALALYERRHLDAVAGVIHIEQVIGLLAEPAERLVMRHRYIEGRDWSCICKALRKIGYSERQVYRLHGSALEKLKGV